MNFRSDAQRRAVFASMFSSKSYPSDSVLSTEPTYVYNGVINNQFSDSGIDITRDILSEAIEKRKGMKGLNEDKTKKMKTTLAGISESGVVETRDILSEAIENRKGMKGLDEEKTKKLEKLLASFIDETKESKTGVSLDEYAEDVDFSKGRAPKMGELVYVSGDPSVGMFGYEGRVVEVNKDSAVIQSDVAGDSVREELGFEEFEDQESMNARREEQTKMHRAWREEEGLNVKEADEVSLDDLEAASDFYDREILERKKKLGVDPKDEMGDFILDDKFHEEDEKKIKKYLDAE